MDKSFHINALELKAVLNIFKSFAAHLQDCDILFRTDNTTTFAYINKFGSIQFLQLSDISRQI